MNQTKPLLHIALQDGFESEPVQVNVNGLEVYRHENLQTDYRISLADSFEIPLPEPPFTVEAHLPKRQIAGSIAVNETALIYIGISFLDGALQFKLSETPFGYV